jgi:2-polyprenyl-6-methoxyphenol hydroxylase-like FAD-dependent oxidoreductase
VAVVLLEAHHDFDRDFRGDTVHPATLELLAQLGLAERLQQIPHGIIREFRLRTKTGSVTIGDLSRLGTPYPFVMTLPQVRLLELLTSEAGKFANFRLVMGANVQRLVEEGGVVRGVRYHDANNRWHEVRALVTVGADGRFSKLRHLGGFEMIKTAPPMDVVWFRLPKAAGDPEGTAELYASNGRFGVVLDRGDEWKVGYVILKGSFAAVRAAGIEAMREGVAEVIPWLADRVGQLEDWKHVAVLNVESSRVTCWHKPGLLLIGDAAHVMSPVAGVGINVAIQDAVAAANVLTEPLKRGTVTEADLAAVQGDREFAVRVVQRIQRVIQDRIAAPGLAAGREFRAPWWLKVMSVVPGLRDVPARLLVFGPRRVRWREGGK